jgi:hypothetical protein
MRMEPSLSAGRLPCRTARLSNWAGPSGPAPLLPALLPLLPFLPSPFRTLPSSLLPYSTPQAQPSADGDESQVDTLREDVEAALAEAAMAQVGGWTSNWRWLKVVGGGLQGGSKEVGRHILSPFYRPLRTVPPHAPPCTHPYAHSRLPPCKHRSGSSCSSLRSPICSGNVTSWPRGWRSWLRSRCGREPGSVTTMEGGNGGRVP